MAVDSLGILQAGYFDPVANFTPAENFKKTASELKQENEEPGFGQTFGFPTINTIKTGTSNRSGINPTMRKASNETD